MRLEHSKGLAASAVGALTVTGLSVGLPVGPAAAAGEGVLLISPFNDGHDVSVRDDGDDDGAFGLAAVRLDPTAAISFQYNVDPDAPPGDPGWTVIGAATMLGDYATINWMPSPSLIGTSIAVRAVATAAGTDTYSALHDVAITDSGPEAVDLDLDPDPNLDTRQVGFFDQPYADSGHTSRRTSVPGCTSATSGSVELSWWSPGDQEFLGQVAAAVSQAPCKVDFGPTLEFHGRQFRGDLDLSAFNAGDVVAFGAERDTDDVQPATLYAQHVATPFASSDAVVAGQPSEVTITVLDVEVDAPIAGAEVRRDSDDSVVGYTDLYGRVSGVQVGGTTEKYYVNTTDVDAYEAGIDPAVDHTVEEPVATSVTALSTDGDVFDDDEYAPGDLYVQVYDQTGNPMLAGSTVEYRLYPTGTAPPATYLTTTTNGQGRAPVAFAPGGPDGRYTLDYRLPGEPDVTYMFRAGDATLRVTPAVGAAAAGGQIAFAGTLKVAGQPLPGRRIGLAYTRGLELVPGRDPDAGIVDGVARKLSLTVTTDAAGAFSLVVDDRAETPQGPESGGKLVASTLAGPGGTASTGNPQESDAGTTRFGSGKGKVKVKLKGRGAGNAVDKLVVKAPASVARERIKVFRMVVGGRPKLVSAQRLDAGGDARLTVEDLNGDGSTTYVVKLLPSDRVQGANSKKVPLE